MKNVSPLYLFKYKGLQVFQDIQIFLFLTIP